MGKTRRITLLAFQNEVKAQGQPIEHVALICPKCGTVQSATDLIAAGAGKDLDAVEKYLGFSCVGRFTGAGGHVRGDASGKGCNWTLGGLFRIHELEVETPDGELHPRFELATAEQAAAHRNRNTAVSA
jgi:hypothetical protein